MIEFPFFNMQQLNLDWIIDKIKGMLSFLPDDGTAGQILRRTADGAEWSDEETGGGAVDSVNGQTGTVVLGADDILMNDNTSVEDSLDDLKSTINGGLTESSFSETLKQKAIKDYVTPQMFGAVADGTTDDTNAFVSALAAAPVVLLPPGSYKITQTIEITNEHRLLSIGDSIINCDVGQNYAFWIHGETGSDYHDTNVFYDTYKGVWFGGMSGGITLINIGDSDSDAILFGINSAPNDEVYGMNAIAQIANVGIREFKTGIQITDKNNYLNTFNRVHFEKCTNCVVFGISGAPVQNSGELFKFFDCIFSNSEYAIKFVTAGWECSLINCSIDFCTVGFKDTNYNKIMMTNGHIEGVGNRSGSALEYGILVGEGTNSLYVFMNIIFDISYPSRGTTLFRGTGRLIIGNSYVATSIEKSAISGEYFLAEQRVTLVGILQGQENYRQYLSQYSNLVPDSLLSGATIGAVTTDITHGIKKGWTNGCTCEVVNGTMFTGQKSVRFKGNGGTGLSGTVKVTLPMTPNKLYNLGMALLKNHDKQISWACSAVYYDKDGNNIGSLPEYMTNRSQPVKDVVYFPFVGRTFAPVSGTEYAVVSFTISLKSGSESLTSDEYIDIEYMYIEEW